MNKSLKTLPIVGLMGLFSILGNGALTAQANHRTTLRVGQARSMRVKNRLHDYKIVSDAMSRAVVRAWFDTRAQRLRIKGLRPGTAKIVFSGSYYYVSAGIPKSGSRRRPPMNKKAFSNTIWVTVHAAKRRTDRTDKSKRKTPRPPVIKRPTKKARRLPMINKNLTKTLGKGRRGTISLKKLFGGPPANYHAMSASHRGIVSAQISNGKLTVRGTNRGSTTLFIRGKVLTSRGLQDVFVKLRVSVR